ncbi:MAG: hypothetical protein RR416_01980 [Clostridia bacterium]
MDIKPIISIVISFIFVMLYILGFVFIAGRGGATISGYHFEPKGVKARMCHNYVMRRFGLWYLSLVAFIHTIVLCGINGHTIVVFVTIGALVADIVLGLVWFNKNKKMKRMMFLERKLSEDENYQDEFSANDLFK